ncbi:MAG TPA: response regulator [Thermodesulfobacteriota bacterium]|nr:response regulator [Thermodesulfobacteriota bacterium]
MGTPLRLLIVEDSEDDAALIVRELRQAGYEPAVTRVATADDLRAAVDRQEWDVVVSDYGLPGFSGAAALALLRERGLDLPFIVVSGTVGEDTAVAMMKAGASDYIMKGNLRRLAPAIERELREAAGRRQRRRAEEDLRASEARYRALFEHAHDAIALLDDDWRFVDVNRAYCDLVGYRPEELLGRGILESVGPESARRKLAGLLEPLRATGQLRCEAELVHRDGSRRLVDVNAARIAPGLYLAVLRDMTERRSLELQLQQAQKMESIGTLAGGIAHDFNNILTGIAGYAQLALAKLSPTHPLHHDLEEIVKQTERATTLTRQLLAFSRRQLIEPRRVDLNHIVRETEKFLRRVIGEHIELQLVSEPKLPPVYVDPVQIEQVLMNLCVNSRDAMPEGGRLLIEIRRVRLDDTFCRAHPWARPGDYVQLSVTDTGVGMDQETLQRIFEPFFTTKPAGKGTGLGLAMVYGIVKQHDGLIHVYSEPGRGTTFKIYFKALPGGAEATAPAPRPAVAPQGGHETVLVAEDDDSVRRLVVRVLEEQGYRVLEAADGEEAVRLFEVAPEPIDLVVLDAVMPKKGGRELYEALCRRSPAPRFLFMSGYSTNAVQERFILDEGLHFLHKPFSPAELARRVRQVLDERPTRGANGDGQPERPQGRN